MGGALPSTGITPTDHYEYIIGALAFSCSIFGEGLGSIIRDNVECIGNESSLMSCNGLTNTHNCMHSQDAGVRCRQGKIR